MEHTKVKPNERLTMRIAALEAKKQSELADLKNHLDLIHESLKPINILKNTFTEVKESPEIKQNLGKAAIGMTSGFLLKKILFGGTKNPLLKLAGFALQSAATNIAAKNSDKIKSVGQKLFQFIASKIPHKKAVIADH